MPGRVFASVLPLLLTACSGRAPSGAGADETSTSADTLATTSEPATSAVTGDPVPTSTTAGTTEASGDGGTLPGTSADPGSTTADGPPVFDDEWCEKFDPRAVHLAGTYQQGAAYLTALVRPQQPRASCIGFETYAEQFWIRPGDHRVVWLELFENDAIRVFTPDTPEWIDDAWVYPLDPYANDELIPTTACAQVDQYNDWWGPRQLLLHPVDGTIIYTCMSDLPQRIYYDQSGTPLLTTKDDIAIAVGNDWTLLTTEWERFAGTLRIAPPGQPPLPVAGPDPAAHVLAARAHGDGFWVALLPAGDGPLERWYITGPLAQDNVQDGTYTPTEHGNPPYATDRIARLTGNGELVYMVEVEQIVDVIVRASVAPGPSTVIYSEQGAPAVSWPTDPHPFVYQHVSTLFTGP